MIVSSETHKIISLQKMLILVAGLCVVIYCIFLILNGVISDSILSNFVQACLIVLIGFCVGLLIIAYGLKVLRNKQVPPPNAWVVENSKVTSGTKALRIGIFLVFVGSFKLIISCCILYFAINMYQLST
jgi:hypothetical protein